MDLSLAFALSDYLTVPAVAAVLVAAVLAWPAASERLKKMPEKAALG